MASKNCHQPRIATIKSNFAKHDWKSQEKTIHWALVNGQVPSLRNIILISEESKPGTVRFDQLSPSQFGWFVPFKCSHNSFSLNEKCGKLNQLQKKIFRFKDVMSSAGSGATKMVADLTHKIRMDDACNIQVWRERDLHINHIFVLDIIAVLIFSSSHLEQRVIPRASLCPTTTWLTTPSTSVIGLAMTRRYHHDHLHHQHRQRHHAHYHVLNVSLGASSAQLIHEST